MAKTLLFQWTGWISGEHHPSGRRKQVSCAAVAPSKAAFKRLTETMESQMAYVTISEISEQRPVQNVIAKAAIAEPGTVFWQDSHSIGPDAPVQPHPDPRKS